jgi:acetolactate decarboxylase
MPRRLDSLIFVKIIRFACLPCALLVALLAGCATPRNTVTQFSTMDALLAGDYDGYATCRTVVCDGDLGIGTFDRLDGEMVLLDGRLYQVRSDGKVYMPSPDATTPFASVVNFRPTQVRMVPAGLNFQEFQTWMDTQLPGTNVVCAFRLTGQFQHVKARSVPAQSKPYPLLVDVVRTSQSVFELGKCSGTLVGFRLPDFVKGINVPGYHVHFLTADRQAGGHVLDFTLEGGTMEFALCSRIDLLLPDGGALQGIDFSHDRSEELNKVEK